MRNNETELTDNEKLVQAKKTYSTPSLIVHGDIEEITQGGDPGDQDQDNSGNSIGGGA